MTDKFTAFDRDGHAAFDLVSGRSKLLVNLTQARRQNIEFRAEILKLTKVYE